MSTQPLLVVEHEAICPPGWVGEWLADDGVALDLRRPYLGEPLPGDLRRHSGLLVLGGSMGGHDDAAYPWLGATKDLVRAAVADGTPVLGICLGHQLVNVALGGTVGPNPRGQQIGVLDVGWTPEAYDDPLFGPLAATSARAVQWNNDIVTEPAPGIVVLAETRHGEVQAARCAPRVWGVQWHPEAGAEVIRVWAEHDRDDAVARGLDIDGYLAQVEGAREEMRASWRGLASGFAALTRDSVDAW